MQSCLFPCAALYDLVFQMLRDGKFSSLSCFPFLEPETFKRCKLLHLIACGSELPSPLSVEFALQQSPHENFVHENLPFSINGVSRRENGSSGASPFSHKVKQRALMMFLHCCSKATSSFQVAMLYDKKRKSGRERQSFEGPALHLGS